MPVSYLRLVSQRIWDQGGMIECENCGHTKAPKLDYVPPTASSAHWLTDPGRYVPHGEGPKAGMDAEIDASLSRMAQRQQAELFKALEAAEAGKPLPDSPAGQVIENMPEVQRAAILRRLRERDAA